MAHDHDGERITIMLRPGGADGIHGGARAASLAIHRIASRPKRAFACNPKKPSTEAFDRFIRHLAENAD